MATNLTQYAQWYEMLEKQREDAIASAADTKQDTINAAESDFRRSQATYGQLAEQLNQAGLTGSGYSDNVTRDAYAYRQEAVSGANKTYAESLRVIEDSYTDKKLQVGEMERSYVRQRDNSYAYLLSTITEGSIGYEDLNNQIRINEYTYEQAASLYKKAGLAELKVDDYNKLMGITETPETETPETETEEEEEEEEITWGDIGGKIYGVISQYDPVFDAQQGFATMKEQISAFNTNIGSLSDAEKNGLIEAFSAAAMDGENAYIKALVENYGNKSAAEADLNGGTFTWANDAAKEAIQEAINEKYGATPTLLTGVGINKNFDEVINKGTKFSLTVNGKNFDAHMGSKVAPDDSISFAMRDAGTGAVYYYEGKFYYKSGYDSDGKYGGDVYEIAQDRNEDSMRKFIDEVEKSNIYTFAAKGDGDTTENNKMVWSVDGLGYGYKGDDFKLYIGNTKMDGTYVNAKLEDYARDGVLIRELNRKATGDPSKTPGYESGFTTFFGAETNSSKKPGQLVIYNNTPYIYTQWGWFKVGGLTANDITNLKNTAGTVGNDGDPGNNTADSSGQGNGTGGNNTTGGEGNGDPTNNTTGGNNTNTTTNNNTGGGTTQDQNPFTEGTDAYSMWDKIVGATADDFLSIAAEYAKGQWSDEQKSALAAKLRSRASMVSFYDNLAKDCGTDTDIETFVTEKMGTYPWMSEESLRNAITKNTRGYTLDKNGVPSIPKYDSQYSANENEIATLLWFSWNNPEGDSVYKLLTLIGTYGASTDKKQVLYDDFKASLINLSKNENGDILYKVLSSGQVNAENVRDIDTSWMDDETKKKWYLYVNDLLGVDLNHDPTTGGDGNGNGGDVTPPTTPPGGNGNGGTPPEGGNPEGDDGKKKNAALTDGAAALESIGQWFGKLFENKGDAEATIKNSGNGLLSEEVKTDLRKLGDAIKNGDLNVFGKNDGKYPVSTTISGSYATVSVSGVKSRFKLKTGSTSGDTNVKNAALGLEEGQVFEANSRLYAVVNTDNGKEALELVPDGDTGTTEYINLKKAIRTTGAYTELPNAAFYVWKASGIGLGLFESDFDLTVGSKTYALTFGSPVEDSGTCEALNELATGSKDMKPETVNIYDNVSGGKADSDRHPGAIVVLGSGTVEDPYELYMYLPVKGKAAGWRKLGGDDVTDAITALVSSNSDNTTPTASAGKTYASLNAAAGGSSSAVEGSTYKDLRTKL